MSDLIELKLATEEDALILHGLQIEAFMSLLEKYHDDETSPARESLEKVTRKITEDNSDFYIIEYNKEKVGGVRVKWYHRKKVCENVNWISPIFIIPKYRNKGIASSVIDKIFTIYPDTIEWRLDTIKQEAGNCHLYEKCGFIRTGNEKIVNEKMTLIDYVKNCTKVRRFEEKDAEEVRNLIVRNFLEVNSKDYGIPAMEKLANSYDVERVLNIAGYAHMYVFEWKDKIVGVGSISSYWGSLTESILLTVFVLPEFHGKGIGRKIINTLEQDELYIRAARIEIPASITAAEFYRKFGYDFKNGVKELDEEKHYRLEKFKEAGQ